MCQLSRNVALQLAIRTLEFVPQCGIRLKVFIHYFRYLKKVVFHVRNILVAIGAEIMTERCQKRWNEVWLTQSLASKYKLGMTTIT